MHAFSKETKTLDELLADVEIEYDENGEMIWPEIPDEDVMQYDRDDALAGPELEFMFGINGFLHAPEAIEGFEIIEPTPEQLQERAEHLRSVLEWLTARHIEEATSSESFET